VISWHGDEVAAPPDDSMNCPVDDWFIAALNIGLRHRGKVSSGEVFWDDRDPAPPPLQSDEAL
jgi:hypothetical protein